MEYFKKIKFSFCFLYSIILLFFHINCDMKIFPDHISAGDPIFNTSQVYLKTNERFIYKLGYYTSSTDNYYSHKYGIYYEPVSCTAYSSSSSITVDNNSNNFIGQPSIIFNRASTKYDPIGRNYFEEISLFKNVITGYGMQCNSHLKVIHNKNIEITYIIPVVSSSNLFTLHIKPPDQSDYTQICKVLTSIFLSLVSNFISWLAIQIFKDIFLFEEHLFILTKESKTKRSFIISFTKLYFILKLKAFAYYFFSFILIFGMTYYLTIFCYIYKESQISLLINYFMGIIESIIISIGISIIITILRFIGLQSKNKYLYRTSVFLDQKM